MAAQNGSITLLGTSGQTYIVDVYLPDAAGTVWTFNPNGAAVSTSTNYWKAPEPCVIVDFSLGTAPTAVGVNFTLSGASYVGQTLRYANQLAANPNRPRLRIPVPAGEQLGGLQY